MTPWTEWWNANSIAIWTMVVGILCNVSCAILGCFLVLRRMSLLGDAISHAVLPGLAVAFLLTGSLNSWAMALGAAVLGILTAFLTQAIHRTTDIPEDASMGVVFTTLFAVGVLLISRIASKVDLDPGCVLYGLIEFVPLDTVPWFGFEVPRALQTLGPALAFTIMFVAIFWKELKIVSFDPDLASAIGFRVGLVHYMLMAMVAGVTVAAFEAVGSILVIAMLIVPPAAARLLSDRLGAMMMWAIIIAILSAILGYIGAARWNTSAAGMMAVAAGALFLLAVFFAPHHGIVSQLIRRARLSLRIAREDVLAELFRVEEHPSEPRLTHPTARSRFRRLATAQLNREGMITKRTDDWRLTDKGLALASELVRTHRLWESFMSKEMRLPLDHVHDPADRMEHFTGTKLRELLAADLANPDLDPQGKPIPPATSATPIE